MISMLELDVQVINTHSLNILTDIWIVLKAIHFNCFRLSFLYFRVNTRILGIFQIHEVQHIFLFKI